MRRLERILAALESARAVTAEDLASELGISKRTLATEIATLQDALGVAAAITVQEGRYRLSVADLGRFEQLRGELRVAESSLNDPSTRTSYIIGQLFRAVVPMRIDQLAEAMSVGRTTVVSDLAKAREFVREDDLTIVGRPNVGLTLQGPELTQRLHVLRHHFAQAYPNDKLLGELLPWCTQVAREAGLGPENGEELARWARVAMDRSKIGHYLEELPEAYARLLGKPAHELAIKLAAKLTAETSIALDEAEVTFLALPIVGMRSPEDGSTSARLGDHVEADELVTQVIEAVRNEMDIDLEGTNMLTEFARHVAFMVNRMRYRIWVDDSAMTNIGEEYPVAQQMATVAASVIQRLVGLPIDRAELAFLTAYFQVFLGSRDAQTPHRLRVAVVAATGRVTAELVKMQVAKSLPHGTEYILINAREATAESLVGYDLVVVSGDYQPVCMAPVVHVTHVLDHHSLERQLGRLRLRLPLRLPSAPDASVLATSLDEDHFFALPPHTDYADAVEYMLLRLLDNHLIEPRFAERILAREAQSQTQLDPWVGFPHATMDAQQGVMVAVGVVPRDACDQGVRVIVLLGVPADPGRSESILVAVYDEVLRLGARRDLLQGLSQVKTFEEFYYFTENNPLTER